MAIAYRDFAPKMTSARTLLKAEQFESFDDAVAAANLWIEAAAPDLLGIETVALPNIWRSVEEGTADASLNAAAAISTWHQFVRVWYRTGTG